MVSHQVVGSSNLPGRAKILVGRCKASRLHQSAWRYRNIARIAARSPVNDLAGIEDHSRICLPIIDKNAV